MKRKLLYFLMVAMFAIVLPSCGDDDDEPTALNQWETQLVGQWDEDGYPEYEDSEYFHYILTNEKTGRFIVTLGTTNIIESSDFTWSANQSTITLTTNGKSESTSYSLKGNTLTIGVGNDAITYKRNNQ
ncbi:MAG: hypothetical protein NC311_17885 [Muribaculaceae bacterium]|nr:hypothetical protein [Muribaculaceae bacterium]